MFPTDEVLTVFLFGPTRLLPVDRMLSMSLQAPGSTVVLPLTLSTPSVSAESGHDGPAIIQDSQGRFFCPLHSSGPLRIERQSQRRRWGEGYAHDACVKRVRREEGKVEEAVGPMLALHQQPRPSTSSHQEDEGKSEEAVS